MLQKDPYLRPTINEVAKSAWLNQGWSKMSHFGSNFGRERQSSKKLTNFLFKG